MPEVVQSLAENIILLVAAGGAVGVLWRVANGVLIRPLRAVHRLIEDELKPNGGISLKDQVCQLARDLEEIKAILNEQFSRIRQP